MTQPPSDAVGHARQPVDVLAVLAAMQDQLDDLTATVEAQQRTIDTLLRGERPAAPVIRDGAVWFGNGRR